MSRSPTAQVLPTATTHKQPSIQAFFRSPQAPTTASEKSPVARPLPSSSLRQRLRSTSERSRKTIGAVFKNVPKGFEYPRPDVVLSRRDLSRRAERMRATGRTIEFLNIYEPKGWWDNEYEFHPKIYYKTKYSDGVVCDVCDNENWSPESYSMIKETGRCKRCQRAPIQPPQRPPKKTTLRTRLLTTEDVVKLQLRT